MLAMLLAATAAQGQGTVNFVNRIPGILDAPVVVAHGEERYLANSYFVAQLYASQPDWTLAPVGEPIAFSEAPEAGYWKNEVRTIQGIAEGGPAQVKVVVWQYALGATYEYAVSRGLGRVGESDVFTIVTGGSTALPAPLVGLKSFTVVVPYVPEPAPTALAVLGALSMLLWRRP